MLTPDWIRGDTLSTVIDGLANVVHPLQLVMDMCRPVTSCKVGMKYLRGWYCSLEGWEPVPTHVARLLLHQIT